MNLGELLTELKENILHDRSDRIAGTPDYLWSDATLVRYINEAHRRFARRSLIIRDDQTCTCTEVMLENGVDQYPLHSSVFAVLSARHDIVGDGDMWRAGHSMMDLYRPPTTPTFDPSALGYLTPGKPIAFSTDETIRENDDGGISLMTMKVYPTPSADWHGNIIKLRVIRTPINKFEVTDLNAMPEIPEDYHLAMLDWAAYLALRIVDRDAGDVVRADKFAMSFEQSVKEARIDVMRKLFAPKGVSFGGRGWSYER